MNDRSIYSYAGEGGSALASGLFAYGFLFLLGIACFFAVNLIGLLVGLSLITLPVFLLSRGIKSVDFYEASFNVRYFLHKKPVTIPYERIKSIRPYTQPRTRERIFIAEIIDRQPVRKVTWHCSDEEFEQLKQLLIGHNIRLLREF